MNKEKEEKLLHDLQLYIAAVLVGAFMGFLYNTLMPCHTASVGGITIENCGCRAALVFNAALYYDCGGGGRLIIRLDNITIVDEGKSGVLFLPVGAATGTRRP